LIKATLGQLSAGENLSMEEMSQVIDAVMQGAWSEQEIGLLLTALRIKGETVDEVAGAALAMRNNMTPIRTSRSDLIDTCGTGGDSSGTFNISTATALLAAAAGLSVAKHGNRAATSKTGSADVLAALGVNVEADVATVERCLDELGVCFCFAPLLHRSMKHVSAVRKKLGVPTIFNLLGPLSNPAGAPHQLLGVGRAELRPLLSSALVSLGTTRSFVVCGEDGLDEVTLSGKTFVTQVTDENVEELVWTPEQFGIEPASLEQMRVDGPQESAEMIRGILSGKPGPPRDITVLNAAAAIRLTEPETSLEDCAKRAATAIDSGAASDLLARLVEVSNA